MEWNGESEAGLARRPTVSCSCGGHEEDSLVVCRRFGSVFTSFGRFFRFNDNYSIPSALVIVNRTIFRATLGDRGA